MNRGDIVLVPVPYSSGSGAKVRPVLVIQSDHNNQRLSDTIVAVITSNTSRSRAERTQLLIDLTTPEGQQSGLLQDSAVTCERIHTILQASVQRRIGSLPATTMSQIDNCIKAALGLSP
jgi:mRNA interferase MazF